MYLRLLRDNIYIFLFDINTKHTLLNVKILMIFIFSIKNN